MGCIALVRVTLWFGWGGVVSRCRLTTMQHQHTSNQSNTTHEITQQISRKLLRMDVLTSETCWALNNEIIKQVTSSWSLFNYQDDARSNKHKVLLQFRLNAINYYDTRLALICVASDVKDASAELFVTPIVKNSYTICTEPISFTFCLDFSLKKKEFKLFNVVWNEGETTPGIFDILVLVST